MKIPFDVYEEVSIEILQEKFKNKYMNKVNSTDVTFMTLAMADFTAVSGFIVNHDYPVAVGLLAVGVLLVYLYHKYGSA